MLKLFIILILQASVLFPAFAGEKGGNDLTYEIIRELNSPGFVFVGCTELLHRPNYEIEAICKDIPQLRSEIRNNSKDVKAFLKCCPTVRW